MSTLLVWRFVDGCRCGVMVMWLSVKCGTVSSVQFGGVCSVKSVLSDVEWV